MILKNKKCLRVADKPTRDVIIAEIMVIGRLEAMLRDPYANYVVQTALDVANPVQKETVST